MATLKGAFIKLDAGLLGGLPNIIVFQFNPDQVTRNPTLLQPPRASTGAGRQDALPQPDGPTETMSFKLRIDANDQLAEKSPIAASSGVLPTLSAIEMLMVPKSFFALAPGRDRATRRCSRLWWTTGRNA